MADASADATKPGAPQLTAEQRRELLRQILEKKARQPRDFPLSLGQDALWFLDRLEPGRPTYGFYPAIRIRGSIDLDALRRAFAELVRRHDSLRTTFPELDGAPVQRVAPYDQYELPIVDLRDRPPDERKAECYRLAEERAPLDLQHGPVLRARLIRVADDDQVLSLNIHHIVFDGWSLGVMIREIFALYTAFKSGAPSPLPPLAVQYSDFAAWQRKHLQGEVLAKLQSHWRKRLAGLPPLEMFTDHPRPAVRTSRGDVVQFALSAELTKQVLEFSRREHFTPFMTLLAGFQELLRRYSGQDDFAVGTPTANRRQKSFEPLIGYFINVLVLRADVSNDPTFLQLVQRVRDTALDAYQHQELTLDKIVETVAPPRDLSRHPLFQVMFVVQNNPRPVLTAPGVELTPLGEMEAARSAKFDLTVPLRMSDDGRFTGRINFNTDLFNSDTIERLADHFQMLLAEAIEHPDRPLSTLGLLRDEERRRITVDWNARTLPVEPHRSIAARFAAHARRSPDAIAVVDARRRWTYGELEAASNRLARLLQARGVGPERPVGVCLERSGALIGVLLAIHKAGGAYVPLDPGHAGAADERVKFVLEDAQIELVVTDEACRRLLPADDSRLLVLERSQAELDRLSSDPVESPAVAGSMAYVIYTSGSTGRPKGVIVTQGNLENAYLGWEHEYRLGAEITSHLQMASFGFDVFTGDLARALGSGGRLVLCSKETMLDPVELLKVLRDERIDAAEFVPVVLRNLVQHVVQHGEKLDMLKMAAVGSDAWYVEDHQRALAALGPHVRLVNSYGLTETTIDSTYFEGDVRSLPPTGIVPIGRPFPNVTLYVLDAWRRPVPVGVAGELYIGGAGVARGYLNRPELDAERFVPDPFSAVPGARLCRTGDRVRWRTDGQLEFLGRADDQVKIRGFRIEPGEVEEVLREHPAIAEAAVLAKERSPGDLRLVAYVAPRPGLNIYVADLRKFLGERLPEYMTPSAFVTLDVMPTTPNGKVDRRSLPDPQWEQAAGDSEYVAPRTAAEEQLASIWREILNVPRVGAHDSFFELGGNSLMAVRLTARIRQEFQVDVPLVALFTSPTLEGLAERIAELAASGAVPIVRPIHKVPRDKGARITAAQELFWSLAQLFPNQPIGNVYAALMLRGELDVPTFERTVTEIVRRHETLRTYFKLDENEEPRQYVLPPEPVRIPYTDLSHLSEAERTAEVERRSRAQSSCVFQLDQSPMFKLELLKLSEREHALLTTVHHIVFDAWSLQVLVREVSELYEAYRGGLGAPLSELSVQYSDYAEWERETLQGEELQRLLDYWRGKLVGATNPELPFKRPVAPGVRHMRDILTVVLPDDWRGKLEEAARRQSVTHSNILLAAYYATLHRYCGVADLTVAMPVANRGRAETQRMIGAFLNTIFLRTQVSGEQTFAELLKQVQQVALEAANHERMPMPKLVQELLPNYNPKRFPITQVMFNYLQPGAAGRARKRRELDIEILPSSKDPVSTRSDLSLSITNAQGKLNAHFRYDATFFAREDMERFAQHFQALVTSVLDDPQQKIAEIPLLSAEERRKTLVEWNRTEADYGPAGCVHQLFEAQARLRPDLAAVIYDDRSLTYAEANARANRLARRLRTLGVGRDTFVGLCLDRCLDLPIAMLAIMKAGGAYVALDPELPSERLDYMIADSRPPVVVTSRALAERLTFGSSAPLMIDDPVELREIESLPSDDLDCVADPDSAIYVIYTSGSTGRPKGAINEHRALWNRIRWDVDFLGYTPGDRFLFKTSLTFDPSFNEVFRAFSHGGTLVVARPGGQRDPEYLAEMIERYEVRYMSFVPSMLRTFLDAPDIDRKTRSLRHIACGGERMTRDLVDLVKQRTSALLVNMYGPTETAISVVHWPVDHKLPGDDLPIGRPMANVRAYVLDPQGRPQPIGVPGELHIGGVAVGRGYWNRPELTAERFVADPFSEVPGARMYKTGDLCRFREDGMIAFLGRIDNQVKIRGVRIELGEIEDALRRAGPVEQAAVLVQNSDEGDARLIGCVRPAAGECDSEEAKRALVERLTTRLRESLPESMALARIVVLAEFPHLASGKIDQQALLATIDREGRATEGPYVAPIGPLEQRLEALWCELLRRPRVGRDVEFFAAGGQSLTAVRLMRRVSAELDVDAPVTDLFEARTIAALAERLAARGAAVGVERSEAEASGATADSTTVEKTASPAGASQAAESSSASAKPRAARRWLAPLRTGGDLPPLFCIHGLGGHAAGFLPLARQLRAGRPVYGLQAQGLDGIHPPHDRIEAMAESYAEEIRAVQPAGPYFVSGWSLGGVIGLEVVRRLTAADQTVALLAMFDTYLRVSHRDVPEMSDSAMLVRIAPRLGIPAPQLIGLTPQQQWDLIAEQAKRTVGAGVDEIRWMAETCRAQMTAIARYEPAPFAGRVVMFRCESARAELDPRWATLCPRMEVAVVPGDHYSMMQKPHVDVLAERLDERLTAAALDLEAAR